MIHFILEQNCIDSIVNSNYDRDELMRELVKIEVKGRSVDLFH